MLSSKSWYALLDREIAVAEARLILPERRRSSMPSCSTSVKPSRLSKGPVSSPASTALATLPTPDWMGSISLGSRPIFISWERKSMMEAAMVLELASGAANTLSRSPLCVSTTAITLSRSTFR
ncbi:hypothetical protein D3C72_1470090 [compost metagenome]